METEQKNRQIFEALGHKASGRGWFHAPTCDGRGTIANAWEGCDFARHQKEPPNFYDSAEASMGLLDLLLTDPDWTVLIGEGEIELTPTIAAWERTKILGRIIPYTKDTLKTAIAEAFRNSRGLKDE